MASSAEFDLRELARAYDFTIRLDRQTTSIVAAIAGIGITASGLYLTLHAHSIPDASHLQTLGFYLINFAGIVVTCLSLMWYWGDPPAALRLWVSDSEVRFEEPDGTLISIPWQTGGRPMYVLDWRAGFRWPFQGKTKVDFVLETTTSAPKAAISLEAVRVILRQARANSWIVRGWAEEPPTEGVRKVELLPPRPPPRERY